MSEPVEERTLEDTSPYKRKCSFDPVDSECSLKGDPSIAVSEQFKQSSYTTASVKEAIITNALQEQRRATHRDSKRYRDGWSPTCNGTTEAFFTNFQQGYLDWARLWPNTRIPRSYTRATKDLEGFKQIEVDLDSEDSASKQVLPCTSAVNTPIDPIALRVQEIDDYYDTIREEQRIAKLPIIKKKFIGFHDTRSYFNFNQILNDTLEYPYRHQQSQYRDQEESEQLITSYVEYVNSKRRRLVHVDYPGIDKYSSDYIPWSKPKHNKGPSYCIKVLDNTFKYQLLGTVGFTFIEYFGHLLLKTVEEDTEYPILPVIGYKNSFYNIVQVVHGHHFTRDTKVISRRMFGVHQRLIDFIPKYNRASYDTTSPSLIHGGTWKSEEVSTNAHFHIVRRVIQERVFPDEYHLLREIQYINAVPHNGIQVPVPVVVNPPTIASRRESRNYLLYRLFLATQSQVKYKVFKYIYPEALKVKKNINLSERIIPARPLPVQENDKQNLKIWRFKQLLLWSQLKDLPDIYPTFKSDFYKVNYIIPRK
jgi:hypothetical protein